LRGQWILVTTQQLYLFNGLYLIVVIAVAYFTRATASAPTRRVLRSRKPKPSLRAMSRQSLLRAALPKT